MKLDLLLVGTGNFGRKYISTLLGFPEVSLKVACRHNWKDLIEENKPEGVIVCTPPQSHVEIAKFSLSRNIPTMVEKPLSLWLEAANLLQPYTAPILVNHSHLFSHRYQALKLGFSIHSIKNIQTFGLGPRPPNRDYSELWDYGPHDISMILDLTQQYPHTVECYKLDLNTYEIVLKFANFKSISRIGFNTNKVRLLRIMDDTYRPIQYDDTVYDEKDRSLSNALQVFIDAIRGKTDDYRLGLDLPLKVMQILSDCENFIQNED